MDGRDHTLGEDDRFHVEMTARATERRNRSRVAIVLAGAVLVVCAGVWLWGFRARAGATRLLRVEQARAVRIEDKLARLEAARSQGADLAAGEPITDMGTRLKRIADRVGLADLPLPKDNSRQMAGGVVKTYRYEEVTAKTLDPIIEWIARAKQADDIEGLELYALEIDPDERAEEWSVSVTFRRWERAQ